MEALEGDVHGRIDLKPLLDRVEMLGRRSAGIKQMAGNGDPKALKRALMQVSRALVPMDYTRGDRFDHDPALAQSAYPVLDPVRRLASAQAGSDEAHFAAVGAKRALNRLAFALDEANAALEVCA